MDHDQKCLPMPDDRDLAAPAVPEVAETGSSQTESDTLAYHPAYCYCPNCRPD
jgi:hypothetical protein